MRKFRASASAIRIASCPESNSYGATAACSHRLSSFFIRGIPPAFQRDLATITVIEFQNAYFTMAAPKRITRRAFSTSASSPRRKPRRAVHKNDRIRSDARSPTPSVRHKYLAFASGFHVDAMLRVCDRADADAKQEELRLMVGCVPVYCCTMFS